MYNSYFVMPIKSVEADKTKYFPIRDVTGDLYFGIGAGKRLKKAIENAQGSIKVVSPFISPETLELLISKSYMGCNVCCATSENYSFFNNDRYRNLFLQLFRQASNENSVAAENKSKRRRRAFYILAICTVIILILLPILIMLIFSAAKGESDSGGIFIIIAQAMAIFLLALAIFHECLVLKNLKKVIVRTFTYTSMFPFKVYRDVPGNPILHSKIYVIDNRVAFIGSLNFTLSGINSNFETVFTVTDPNKVMEISNYCDSLFLDEKQRTFTDFELGKILCGWSENPY